MEDNGNNYEQGLIPVHTDFSVMRYAPSEIKVVPKKPLTEKEKTLIFELDFLDLAETYSWVFRNLLSAGETPDDLVQEAYLRLPNYFARYDKSFLTPAQRKDINQLREAFKGWFKIKTKHYRDKTFDNLKQYRNTKYGNGKKQYFIMPENIFETYQCVSSEELLGQQFLNIRRALWAKLSDGPEGRPVGPEGKFRKDPSRTNIQLIIDMKDSDATIGSIRFTISQFQWTKEERIEALEIIEKYYDQLWELTHHLTGQEFSNWASDWLEAIANGTESQFIKAGNKTLNGKVA